MTLSEFVDSTADSINRSVIAELENDELYTSFSPQDVVDLEIVASDFSW